MYGHSNKNNKKNKKTMREYRKTGFSYFISIFKCEVRVIKDSTRVGLRFALCPVKNIHFGNIDCNGYH